MLEQQLVVDRTYRFTFKSEFERHGVCSTTNGKTCLHKGNGVFTLKQISSFQDIVLAGVDLYSSFFKPLNITEDEYKQYFSGKPLDEFVPEYTVKSVETEEFITDTIQNPNAEGVMTVRRRVVGKREEVAESNRSRIARQFVEELCYGSFPIYKLVDVVDNDDVLYVPEKAIKGMPEVGIKEYQDCTIAVNIGYYENPSNLDNVVNALRERLALYGVQPLSIELFSADTLWMNPDEYAQLRSLRIPGKEVVITDNNKSFYLNERIIQDGTIKKIVDTRTPDEETEVDVESIKTQKGIIIDPQMFIRQMNPTSELVFESGKYYYRKATGFSDSNKRYVCLVEGVDWAPGDPIEHFIKPTSAKPVDKVRYFRGSGTEYNRLSLDNSSGLAAKYTADGVEVFYHTVTWTQMSTSDRAASGTVYYMKTGEDEYAPQSLATGAVLNENYFTKNETWTKATAAYITANPNQVYYLKKPTTYTEVHLNPSDSTASYYQLDEYFVLDFSGTNAENLVAKTFTYTNRLGSLTETELSLDELAGIALSDSAEVYIANSIVQRKYNNRWFEYTHFRQCTTSDVATSLRRYYRKSMDEYVDATSEVEVGQRLSDQYYQQETVAVVINVTNFDQFSMYKGTVLGETGEVSKEVFLVDESEGSLLNRNYFAQYSKEVQKNVELTAQNAALRALVDKLSADNVELRKGNS